MTAANVVRLCSRFACAACGATGTWRLVGRDRIEERSCDADIAYVARSVPTDGFTPLSLIPVFPNGSAA